MRPILLFAFLAVCSYGTAATSPSRPDSSLRMTVSQLAQVLTSAQGKQDADLAQQLAALDLTERLSEAKLTQFTASLQCEKSRTALLLLANRSAFLPPPTWPPTPLSYRRFGSETRILSADEAPPAK